MSYNITLSAKCKELLLDDYDELCERGKPNTPVEDEMLRHSLEIAKKENEVILLEEDYHERYEGFDPSSPESLILLSLEQTAYQESSLRLAALVENQFKHRVDRRSRGVKMAPFWVLWRTSMPSVLIETGYLTNLLVIYNT